MTAHTQVVHFQAMFERNRANEQLAKQVRATLDLAKAELEDARKEQARITKAIRGKEDKDRFLKF